MVKKIFDGNLLLYYLGAILSIYIISCSSNIKKETSKDKSSEADSSLKLKKQILSESLTKHIGENFSIKHFEDTAGIEKIIDFKKSKITIIDFWMKNCPPCNAEMSQFDSLINGKEDQVTIYSISINQFNIWKDLFVNRSDRYSFLETNIPNWKHLVLKSTSDQRLHNTISEDRLTEIINKLDVTFYPSYFVLNREGIILSRPESAVEYLKKQL